MEQKTKMHPSQEQSVRQFYAGMAMQALIQQSRFATLGVGEGILTTNNFDKLAKVSFSIADAMLKNEQ